MRSKQDSLILRTKRSAKALQFGARGQAEDHSDARRLEDAAEGVRTHAAFEDLRNVRGAAFRHLPTRLLTRDHRVRVSVSFGTKHSPGANLVGSSPTRAPQRRTRTESSSHFRPTRGANGSRDDSSASDGATPPSDATRSRLGHAADS
jgi:hypothetical protein